MKVEWLNGETTGRKGRSGVQGPRAVTESGPTPAGRRAERVQWVVSPLFPTPGAAQATQSQLGVCWHQ